MNTCIDCGGSVSIVRNPFTKYFAFLFVDADTGEAHVCKLVEGL